MERYWIHSAEARVSSQYTRDRFRKLLWAGQLWRLQVGSCASQRQIANTGRWDDFLSLFTGNRPSSNLSLFCKRDFFFFFPQMALIFSFVFFFLSLCVRICFLLQQRSRANDTFEEEDLRDSAGNQRKQGYTSHCFLERVTSNSIWSFQAVVRCVYHKPVSYKANRIMRK